MNATLQCLGQIEKLVNYFKYNNWVIEIIKKYQNKKELCLTKSFKLLIENLWPSNINFIDPKYNHRNSSNAYFSPVDFKEKISRMNPLFQGVQANDSKDLVNFIIMTLHNELNRVHNSNNNISNSSNFQIDQTNELLIMQKFQESFIKENQSIISDLFYAMSKTNTQCSGCSRIKYNFQIYFFLIFPLEEIRKYKEQCQKQMIFSQNMMNMNSFFYQQNLNFNSQLNVQNINSVNLDDCFLYNQKNDFFTGQNAMYCNFCNNQLNATYQTFLYTTPEILIIILNRGKEIEFRIKLEFNEYLNLYNYVERKEFGYYYQLIGVVTHMGESGASGHFIAFSKSPIDQQWYKYNDDLVSKVTNFQREIIDYAMPYILFYQKINDISKINSN